MSELEKYVSEQISKIIPEYEKLDVRANISDSSHSIEFYATVAGKKMQCYGMVDNGLINEKELDGIFKNIASYIRNTSELKKGTTNKYSFTVSK